MKNIKNQIKIIPFGLLGYLTFNVFISGFDLIITFIGPRIRESIIPFTGWNMSSIYMFATFFASYLCLKPNRKTWTSVIVLLIIQIIFGIIDLLIPHGSDFGNPYLKVSPLRPLWTIVIPLLWILVFLTPGIRRYSFTSNKQIDDKN